MEQFSILLDIATYLACMYFVIDSVFKKDKNTFLIAIIAASCWQMSCNYQFDSKYEPNYKLSTIMRKP